MHDILDSQDETDIAGRNPNRGTPLETSSRGLNSAEAKRRFNEHGANEIVREKRASALTHLAGQFKSPIVWLLLGACLVSGALGEVVDAIAIAAIVVINAVVGFVQEFKAESAIMALRSMTAPRARVLRDGHVSVIPSAEIVPGDVLLLEAGDLVAADGRLLEANRLSTNQAALTGESAPASKSASLRSSDAPLAERHDAVFMGTSVATGTGAAMVIATGMKTELGRIAHLLETAEDTETPLQRRLAQVSRVLLYLCLVIVALVAIAGLVHGRPWLELFMTAVSLAVAAVPEGLPAIVTIALAIGVQRMAARRVLVRRLPAVETLGCATVVCTDKTGTLTTGIMAVRELWGPDHDVLLRTAVACCDAELGPDGRTGIGDPTEVAILAAGALRGMRREDIERENPRKLVQPFDSERMRMSIQRSDGVLYVKGAVEVILRLCSAGLGGVEAANAQMAARGLRVLAVARGDGPEEASLSLVGLVGIADPPRTEAIEAIAAARAAGIKTVMITGDHPVTAGAIAKELGLVRAGDRAEELVHARATPEDKLKIVRDWKARGEVVAMTGDGVNDAPALREAHIGVAMGRTGTEVTREASDMVLADDNFASIIAAIREGRGIFDNIRKALVYLLTGNAAELLIMFGAALGGLAPPLLPLHLLWINLVTDGLPALALVMDPPAGDVLERPPRRPDEVMLGRRQWVRILSTGALQTAVSLGVFVWALQSEDLLIARSLAFSSLVLGQLFLAFAARSPTQVYWQVGPFTNVRLIAVVLVSALVQLTIHTVSAMQRLFEITQLTLPQWLLSLGLGLVPVSVVEVLKLVSRMSGKARAEPRPQVRA